MSKKLMKIISVLLLVWSSCISGGVANAVDVTSSASPTSESIPDGLPIVNEGYSRTETLIHTVVQIHVFHEGVEEIVDGAFKYVSEMEQLLSTNLQESDVYKINSKAGIEPVEVSPITIEIIKKAIEVGEISQGLFDISIGPIVELWKIGTPEARVPSDDEIQEALQLVDYRKIQIDEEKSTVFLEEEGMRLELGGISKGYIGSGIASYFQSNNITTAIINLGGNVVVMGTSPSNKEGWNVGVQDPDRLRGEVVGSQRVINAVAITSGIYERFIEEDGKFYHHIMDPRTGYPLDNNVSAVTVFAPTSFEGDAYSTALFMMGIDGGINFVNSLDGFEVVYIDKDKGVHLSNGIKESFQLTNDQYHIVE